MKELFLTSDVNLAAKDISQKIHTKTGNMRTAFITTPIEKEEGDLEWHEQNKTSMANAGFDIFIREFIENGGKYIGTSTGSFIMAEDTAPGLSLETYLENDFDTKGIGLVNFLVMPHWGSSEFKESYEKMPHKAYNMTTSMIVLTNTQYVWVRGDSVQIVDVK